MNNQLLNFKILSCFSFFGLIFNLSISFAEEKEIEIQDLLLYPQETYQSILQIQNSFRPESKLADLRDGNEVAFQVARHIARRECTLHFCGQKPCIDYISFRAEPKTIDIGQNYLYPTEVRDKAIFVYTQKQEFQSSGVQWGYYLRDLICSDEWVWKDLETTFNNKIILKNERLFPIYEKFEPNVQTSRNEVSIFINNQQEEVNLQFEPQRRSLCKKITSDAPNACFSEMRDWWDILKSFLPGVGTTIKDLYSGAKLTARTCPKETIQWAFCRFGSIVLPGMAGSYWLGDKAKRLEEIIAAKKSGIETNYEKYHRLKDQYTSLFRSQFSSTDQTHIESLLGQIHSRIETSFDHGGEVPLQLKQLERIMMLPKSNVLISSHEEGENLKKMLEKSRYPEDIQDQIYEAIALNATAVRAGVQIPVRPVFLKGKPGQGKTRLVRKTAKEIGYPLCEIKFDGSSNIMNYLFGGRNWGNGGNGEFLPGKLVECMTEQKGNDGNLRKDTVKTVIIFFDELEKVLNQASSGPIRQFFLDFLNNSPEGKVIKAPGLASVELDFRNAIVIVAANDNILPESLLNPNQGGQQKPADPKPSEEESKSNDKNPKNTFDPAFESRLNIVTMREYSSKDKVEIGESMLKDAMEIFHLSQLSDETMANHKRLIQLDDKPGVRILEAAIYANIAREAAMKDGWTLKPMNLQQALQIQIPVQ